MGIYNKQLELYSILSIRAGILTANDLKFGHRCLVISQPSKSLDSGVLIRLPSGRCMRVGIATINMRTIIATDHPNYNKFLDEAGLAKSKQMEVDPTFTKFLDTRVSVRKPKLKDWRQPILSVPVEQNEAPYLYGGWADATKQIAEALTPAPSVEVSSEVSELLNQILNELKELNRRWQ